MTVFGGPCTASRYLADSLVHKPTDDRAGGAGDCQHRRSSTLPKNVFTLNGSHGTCSKPALTGKYANSKVSSTCRECIAARDVKSPRRDIGTAAASVWLNFRFPNLAGGIFESEF